VTDATNGGTQLVTTFTSVARPGAAAHIRLSPTFDQTGCVEAGTVASQPPAILVVDAYGNPVPATLVTFTPGENSGGVTGGSQTTGTDGTAAPTAWTVGTLAPTLPVGQATIVATVPGADNSPFEFVGAKVVANTPAELRLDAAPASAQAGSTVEVHITVLDPYGNVVDQRLDSACIGFDRVTVDWEVVEGNGCLPFTTPCPTTWGTQQFPFHRMYWYLSTTAGVNKLRAGLRGHPEVAPLTITVDGT
jgi:hypothetical protein